MMMKEGEERELIEKKIDWLEIKATYKLLKDNTTT